jgi:mannonate dehydratase
MKQVNMLQSWRWFGPSDKTSLLDARQAGATVIVSALHHIAPGEIWPEEEIEARRLEIATNPDGTPSGLVWGVVESLPVAEGIKTGTGNLKELFSNYRKSLENLSAQGLKVICYNFMPVLDWTRTHLAFPLPNGARAMRFDLVDFAAFDIFILERMGADQDFPEDIVNLARDRFVRMNEAETESLTRNIIAGLPGSMESWTLEELKARLEEYRQISPELLHQNHLRFLEEVAPTAERLGIRLCCHPDDPPFPLLGLPRIMSTAEDYRRLFRDTNSSTVGMTFCAGSLAGRHDNDLPAMAREFAPYIHFVHLRNVTRDAEQVPCSFFEDEHLSGQTDMVAVVKALLEEEERRRISGRMDHQIPMRPDHGHEIMDDLSRSAQPGYPALGRLKGLAELRGVISALEHERASGRQASTTDS